MQPNCLLLGLTFLASLAVAHPGHDLTQEILERREFLGNIARTDLSHCSEQLARRGITRRNIERRSNFVQHARSKRVKGRSLEDVLAKDHNSTSLGYTLNTDAATLFSGNNSCILTPEVTQGPYYVGGESIRRDIRESQGGVHTTLDYQLIDINTCNPLPNLYLEIWHCNSTGVYSGVVASGNGDSSDSSNINATFHRGIQLTDSDGVAQFETTFPGHYTGRATHIHTMVHSGAKRYCNGTLGNIVNATHVGQTFFDQSLITEVEKVEPYASNTQEITANSEDSILSEETANNVDPFFEYVYLGDNVDEGIFGWIAIGINGSAVGSEVTPASFLYESGGVANANSNMGGPGGSGGPGGNGTMPGNGTIPSGVPPTGGMPTSSVVA